MSGTFANSLRSLRTTSLFSQTCRNFRLPVPITIAKRHGSIWASSSGTNSFVIESNCMSDEQIYGLFESKYPTITNYLGLKTGAYPIAQLRNMNDIFFPQQPANPKTITLPEERTVPKITDQKLMSKSDTPEPLEVKFSDGGREVLNQNRGAMERTLSLLPQEAFDETTSSVEKTLTAFDAQYEILDAKYYDIDEFFKTKAFDFSVNQLMSFLQHTDTFSEKIYAADETTPIQDLDPGEATFDRIRKVLTKKFNIDTSGFKDAFEIKGKSDKERVTCPGWISAHRTAATICQLKDKKTGKILYSVTCSDVEMSLHGSIYTVGNTDITEFTSKGLNSGANFAFGGEAGDHKSATGGSSFLRIYDSEEAALDAFVSRPNKGTVLTESTRLYIEDDITVQAAKQLITRVLLIKDYPTGIYSDYPLVSTGSLPANNCGTIILEQKAIANIKQNIFALAIPTSPTGVIQIPDPKAKENSPDYWLHKALASGLNAQYAQQWAEGVFAEVTSELTVRLRPQTEKSIKEELERLFIEAYYGLYGAAIWQELFAERNNISDETTKKEVNKLLDGPIGQLALLRPPTHIFNIVKAALAYQEFLVGNQTKMLDVISTVQDGVAVLKTPNSTPPSGTVALFDPTK